MSIVLQSTSGGSVTINEPTTASNFTQTLPAVAGTFAVADGSGNLSVTGNLSFNSGYGSTEVAYGCRAWGLATWSGGTPTLAASGGLSSITDLGTGNMRWNLSITLPDTNYSVLGSVGTDTIWVRTSKDTKTTTQVQFGFANITNTAEVDPTTPCFNGYLSLKD